MRAIIISAVLLCWAGCSPPGEKDRRPAQDTTRLQTPPPPGGRQAPAAIRENMSLIGAVVAKIAMVDSYRYAMTLELRTALPSGNTESMAEPGQTVTVYPEYIVDERGAVSLQVERNRRLFDLRSRQPGDAVLGKISLRADGTWRLIDTEF